MNDKKKSFENNQEKKFEEIYDGLLYEQYGAMYSPKLFKDEKYFSEYINLNFEEDPKPSRILNSGLKNNSKISLSKRTLGLVIAACMIFSMLCGFGGAFLANNITGTPPKIIYNATASKISTDSSSQTNYALSVPEISEIASNSVVEIITERVSTSSRLQQYIAQGAGSGVIVTTDGYIVTNNHVIEGASKIKVIIKDSKEYDAKVIGYDSKSDIAIIKIDASNLTPAVFGNSDNLIVGELAVAIGNPLGKLGGTVTNGIISALNREITIDGQSMSLLQTNAAINPGNSGGGLFNGTAQLIGITNAKSSGSDIEGIGFAIPINVANPIIQQLITNGYVEGRVSLGISVVDINDVQTAMIYRVQRLGVYVVKIADSSDAQNAGFMTGDCILSVNGTQISKSADFKAIIDKSSVGDTLKIIVLRNNKEVNLSIVLKQYKPQ